MSYVFRRSATLAICGCALALLVSAPTAQAQLAHRYSFSGNINDTVGTAHGVLVNNTGLSTYSGGALTLGNNGTQTSAGAGDYVDLPNGSVSGLGNSATFEFWTTWNGPSGSNWQRFFDFGRSDAGENLSTGGNNSDYVFATPRGGAGVQRTGVREGSIATETFNDSSRGLFPLGAQQHVAVTINGVANTASTYLNGALVGTSALPAGFTLSTMNDVNNWLGRAQFNDPSYVGSYNEFRTYSGALTADQIAQSRMAGPNALNTKNQALVAAGAITQFVPIALPTGSLNFDNPVLTLTGNQTLGGVPFNIATSGVNDGWNAFNAAGANRSLTIPINTAGVIRADLLLGTYWGEQNPGTYASVLFQASDGTQHVVELDGNFELRDYQQGTFANLINNTSTTAVIVNGNARVDKTMIILPDEWASKVLTSITIQDFGLSGSGADNFQRLFINGLTITVATPEPSAVALWSLLGALSVGVVAWRRRMAKR